MATTTPPVYFYLPKEDWPSDLPRSADKPWEKFGKGIYCWTLQTYLHLQASGFPCHLVDTLPEAGIVLAHRDSLPYELRPSGKVLLVCLKADRNPHPYAQCHIVQNPEEEKLLSESIYLPHWPQPGLIKRLASRGSQVKNVAYMGISFNLASELKDAAWKETLKQLGLDWQIRPREAWHNYSDVDVVVAIRSFQESHAYSWKPATKLYNCWHAGVPAILGPESAFRSERQGELDYLEVSSLEETIAALMELKESPDFYQAIVRNGEIRSQEKSKEQIVHLWITSIQQFLFNQYEDWCSKSAFQQTMYIYNCFSKIKANAARERIFQAKKSFMDRNFLKI
jgi:hypothetical protein